MMLVEWNILEALSLCDIRDRPSVSDSLVLLFSMEAHPSLLNRIADAQKQDPDISYIIQSCKSKSRSDDLKDFDIDIHG